MTRTAGRGRCEGREADSERGEKKKASLGEKGSPGMGTSCEGKKSEREMAKRQ